MPYRLIALDLDGTLLDPQHRISPANHAAVQECLARGIRVLIATGRLFASAGPYARALELAGPQITLNGGVFADAQSGSLTTRDRLSPAMLAPVFDLLETRGIHYTIFGPDTIYAPLDTPRRHLDVLDGYGEPPAVLLDRAALLALPAPLKVLTFLPPGPLDAELAALVGASVDTMRTGPLFFEFLPPGVSKGAALAELIAHAGLDRADVLAIGDSENDVSMFDVAGMSVAMGGAPPAISARARASTASCTADGVALAIQRYVLAP
jgi:Cof subfamily protein (haloacid dehalogenase superfamily)